ncbi:hypothetical protein BU17DRAFT_65659 [Hysterangium stoloniferum]|nr:hypothetical protein BU17DRAFT_65659 [Hysterangium stoloniferum]
MCKQLTSRLVFHPRSTSTSIIHLSLNSRLSVQWIPVAVPKRVESICEEPKHVGQELTDKGQEGQFPFEILQQILEDTMQENVPETISYEMVPLVYTTFSRKIGWHIDRNACGAFQEQGNGGAITKRFKPDTPGICGFSYGCYNVQPPKTRAGGQAIQVPSEAELLYDHFCDTTFDDCQFFNIFCTIQNCAKYFRSINRNTLKMYLLKEPEQFLTITTQEELFQTVHVKRRLWWIIG